MISGPVREGSDEGEGASSSGSEDEDGRQQGVSAAEPASSSGGQRLAQELGEADRELLESIQSRGESAFPS